MENFVTLDLESSGLSSETDRIIEYALVYRENGRLEHRSSLINPGVSIPPEASAIHHLTNRDLVGAPKEEEVLNRDNFPWKYIVAHNAKFDRSFLPKFQDLTWICTMRTCQHLYPDLPNFKNMTIRYAWDLQVDLPDGLAPHRALYDALVTHFLFEKILQEHSFEEILSLQDKPVLSKKAQFGKYKGQLWKDIDRGYLRWMLSQDQSGGIDEDLRYTARYWLNH